MDTLTTNTNYIVAAPSKPTKASLVKKVSRELEEFQEIREAHLPTVIELGDLGAGKLTLFAVVTADCEKSKLHKALTNKINGRFLKKQNLDIKLIHEDFPLLESIRATNCIVGWRD